MRTAVIAYGAGVATGVVAAWGAARRWERAALAWSWAWAWVAEAVWLAREAAVWLLGAAVALAVVGAMVWTVAR